MFIGPTASAIDVMGDKISAKAAVTKRNVPVVPGIARSGLTNDDLIAAAPAIGYPMLIKPSAGGGGKGMHVVERAENLPASIDAARREAAASFGDDALFIERYLTTPRHIEVQVLADEHGNVIHLGERECSLQRQHPEGDGKAPSALLDEATRAAIGQAACETARSVDYRGAGTVEFIVEATKPDEFFFMEMNTRLQVEHPVTEQITGIDLVEQQLRIAAGEPLGLTQADIVLTGHSIEARVYAEDPAAGFLPTGGLVTHVTHPTGEHVRVDTAISSGLNVSIDYDPMLAKIITWGEDRETARRRLVRALDETALLGFPTNIEFMRMLLELPEVVAGDLDTGLIGRVQDSLEYARPGAREFAEAALLLDSTRASLETNASRETLADDPNLCAEITPATATGPWARHDGWRLGSPAVRKYALQSAGEQVDVSITGKGEQAIVKVAEGTSGDQLSRPALLRHHGEHRITSTIAGITRTISALVSLGAGGTSADRVALSVDGAMFEFSTVRAINAGADEASSDPRLESPMPGTVVLVHAENGTHVEAGDPVIVVEAMKMEHVLRATVAGTVSLQASVGDQVARGATLAVIQVDTGETAVEQTTTGQASTEEAS